MLETFFQISWIAVIAATIVAQVIGGLWFTALFGKPYARALGREGQPPVMAPIYIVGPLVCNLIMVIAMAMLMRMAGISTTGAALGFGLLTGAGLLASTTINTGINPNIPRPPLYGLISGSYFLLAGVVISLILAAFG